MHTSSSVLVPALAGIHPNQHPFIDQVAPNGFSNIAGHESMESSQLEPPEPSAKRLRTDNGPVGPFAYSPPFVPLEYQQKPFEYQALPQTMVSNGIHETQSPPGPYIEDDTRIPNASTTSTSITSSSELRKSSSPPTTPGHSLPTPSAMSGISILDSNKVDIF